MASILDKAGRSRPLALAAFAGAVAATRSRERLGLPRWLSTALAAGAPLAASQARLPGRAQAAFTWIAQMWAYKAAFEIPFDRPGAMRERLAVDRPIRWDARVGSGTPPPQALQRALRDPPRLSPLDRVLTGVYALWDLEPHAALAWILLRDPDAFPRSAARLAVTYDATLLGYWLAPQAPPWWASEQLGRMGGEVRRVALEVEREVRGQARPAPTHEVGANPWAAMPSDHFATALMTALVLYERDRRAGVVAGAYAAALGFSLVYLGEHYVVDLLAGGLLAGAVRLAIR